MATTNTHFIFLRESWPWMAGVSGFDPFISALENLPGLDSKSIWIPESLPPPDFAERVFRKIRKSRPAAPGPSPFTERRHEVTACKLIAAMSGDPAAVVILSAGETQYGRVLSETKRDMRSRLVVCFHQPPSWWRLHWRNYQVLDGLRCIVCLSEEQ